MTNAKKMAWMAIWMAAAVVGIYGTAGSSPTVASTTAGNQAEVVRLQEKMLNAIDYYSRARGEFIYTSSKGQTSVIEFDVQQGANAGSVVSRKDRDGQVRLKTTSNGQEILNQNEQNRSFTKNKIVKWDIPKDTPRVYVGDDGEKHYMHRQDPASAGIASDVTFPQNLAFWLEEGRSRLAGRETVLGREAAVIEGELSGTMQAKAKTFRMLVDTRTGILLGLETLKKDGTSGIRIEVTRIEIDDGAIAGLHSRSFDVTPPAGYREEVPFP